MIFVSYFTGNGRYPELAKKLMTSLNRFGLFYQIQLLKCAGDKPPNNAKANFILNKLATFRRPVIWMDCDTEIISLPSLLFQNQHDFAIYNWHADSENTLGMAYDPNKLLCSGGVQYWGYTAAALEMCMRWENRLKDDLRPDDQVLDSVFNEERPPVNPLWLPKSYNRMTAHWPKVTPIINHDWTNGQHGNSAPDEKVPVGTLSI